MKANNNTNTNLPEGNLPENARLKRIVQLIRLLMDKDTSPQTQARIREWFAKSGGAPLFDEGVAGYVESLEPGTRPLEGDSLRRYNAVATKVGLPRETAPGTVRKLRRAAVYGRVAAVLIPFMILAGMGYFAGWFGDKQPDLLNPVRVETLADNQKHIFLPDGSEVWLRAGSTIDYSEQFTDNRIVRLSGGAFFDVAKMQGKPFVVSTGALDITVTGTQFDVRDYDFDPLAEVALVTGSVDVKAGRKNYSLTPSDKLSFDKSAKEVELSRMEDSASAADWRGCYSFSGASLATVLEHIADHYNVNIHTEGVSLDVEPVSIEFDHLITLHDALSALSATYGTFVFEISGGEVTIKPIN